MPNMSVWPCRQAYARVIIPWAHVRYTTFAFLCEQKLGDTHIPKTIQSPIRVTRLKM